MLRAVCVLLSAIGLLLLAPSARAEGPDLVLNGNFVSDNSGWTFSDSSGGQNVVFWSSQAGTPPSPGGTGGSLNLTAFRNSSITASQCIAIAGNMIDASALVFSLVEAGPAVVQLVMFASGDCSGVNLGTVPMAPIVDAASFPWITHQALGTRVPPGSRSIRFELGASDSDNNSDGDYLFDNARLETANIFEDAFEGAPGN